MEDGAHCSFGFKSTKNSVLENSVVSVPSSGRPTWETTCVTSGKAGRNQARTVHDVCALGRADAGSGSAAHPDGAFIKVREKFGADASTGQEIEAATHRTSRQSGHHPTVMDGPGYGMPITSYNQSNYWIFPAASLFPK